MSQFGNEGNYECPDLTHAYTCNELMQVTTVEQRCVVDRDAACCSHILSSQLQYPPLGDVSRCRTRGELAGTLSLKGVSFFSKQSPIKVCAVKSPNVVNIAILAFWFNSNYLLPIPFSPINITSTIVQLRMRIWIVILMIISIWN